MIIRAKEGDLNALEQMYKTFAPKMRMTCSRILKKYTDIIDDIVHDSFILAYSSLDQLKNPEKLEAWLCTITRNATIRYIQNLHAKSMQQLCAIKIETGIQYTLLHSTFSIGRSGYSIDQNQKLHYIGIPLRVSYQLWGYKNLSVISSGGIITNIPVYGDVKETYIEDYRQIPSDRWSISAPWQFSIGTSIGLQYKFAPRLSFYVEPTLYYQIPNGSSVHSIWTEHPFMYSMPFGIRLTW